MKVLWILSTLVFIILIGQIFSNLVIDSKGRVNYAIRVVEPAEEREERRQEQLAPKEWERISREQMLFEKEPFEGEKPRLPEVEPRQLPMEAEATYEKGIQQTPRVGEGIRQKSPEPQKLYFIDDDGTIRVWDPARNEYQIIK